MEEVKNKELPVATNLEIGSIVFIFLAILFFLFPDKGSLVKLVLKEKSNYDLSISYLKSLIVSEPENEKLESALSELYLKTGKIDELIKFVNEKSHSKNPKIIRKLNIYKYGISKQKKEFLKMGEIVKEINKEIRFYDKKIVEMIINDMEYLGQYGCLFDFVYNYIKIFKPQKEEILRLAEILYYQANNRKDRKNSSRYINILLKYNKEKWLKSALFYYENSDRERAIKILKEMIAKKITIEEKTKLIEKLAYFYLVKKKYKLASLEYEKLLMESKEKFKYFKLAINSLMLGKRTGEVYLFSKRYEMIFVRDVKVSYYILKLYQGLGMLGSARDYSKLILKVSKK